MRHHHRFSRSRSADDSIHTGHERASLHALWHAFTRQHPEYRGERGEGFERRRGDRHEYQRDDQGRERHHAFHGDERGHRGHHAYADEAHGRRDRHESRSEAHGHGHRGHDRLSLHALWHAIGGHHEHRGGGRGGRFGGGGGGGAGGSSFGGDGDGFPRGRKFSSDDLQLLLMSLIEAQPSHGYELIKALETRSNGFYTPSPGMVYPALTYLEELGYVTVQLEGNRKRYELSDTGRDYLAANRDRIDLMLAKLSHFARKMDSVRRAFAGEEPADISEGGWLPELTEARRKLKNMLVLRGNASADEQRRIAVILMRAAREIESDIKPDNASNEQSGEQSGEQPPS
ncbi:PadR family transcriptional regulator [Paraburkholderia bryophila]|uniref:DNA-binding PadR family transcriptional regulator n=1 Tax=Paraburkholderia bryophila TaxID=420952 RepID=A0A7Y9W993_9BURK|nr:PadR family transcriptional regulator [Paraburkholderia bryophila]NYH16554.1 DNA-binding PadR family transcriptional regulator [Paraburkholderia bryophila]